ncbi:MAG: hypothetical protein R3E14_08400 [Erythrobacter sp.]
MEDGLFTNQGKKLLFIALFLVLVAALVGGEDDPGMIAQLSDGNAKAVAPKGFTPPPEHQQNVVVRNPRPAARNDRNNTSLEDWYAEAAPSEPLDPEPVDESYLINDTQPAVSAAPQAEMVK